MRNDAIVHWDATEETWDGRTQYVSEYNVELIASKLAYPQLSSLFHYKWLNDKAGLYIQLGKD